MHALNGFQGTIFHKVFFSVKIAALGYLKRVTAWKDFKISK
jgi:hypothetical protein